MALFPKKKKGYRMDEETIEQELALSPWVKLEYGDFVCKICRKECPARYQSMHNSAYCLYCWGDR